MPRRPHPHRHPRLRAGPHPERHRRRRPDRRHRPARPSWSRSAPRATPHAEPLAQIGGTGVFVSALREALLRRRGRPGGALAQGPAHRARRGHRAGRRARPRGPARRRGRPRRAHPRRAARRAPASAPAPRAGSPRSRRSASGSSSSASAATWTPGSARWPPASSTRSCSPAPAWPGWAASTRRPRCSTRSRCCPRRVRERSRWSAGPTATSVDVVRSALDDPHTRACVEAERALLAELEAGCSAPVGALAEVAEGDLGDELWVRAVALSPDGALSVRRSASGPLDDAVGVGQKLAAEMLADGAAELISEHTEVARRRL